MTILWKFTFFENNELLAILLGQNSLIYFKINNMRR